MLISHKVKLFVTNLILFTLITNAYAGDTLYFAGDIKISKKVSYKYTLRFSIDANNKLTGYSLSDPRGANETKTKITGSYDSATNMLSFEESAILRSSVDLKKNDLCFVKANLKLKKTKLFETLSGKFTAFQPGNTSECANGEIKMINTNKAKGLIERFGKKTDSTETEKENKIENNAGDKIMAVPNELLKITDDKARNIPFTGNFIKFTLWDNGQVDGDRISIILNGEYLIKDYIVTTKLKVLEAFLPDNEIDTIKIIALNEGTLPPNTATIKIESITQQYPIQIQAKLNEVRTIYLRRKR